MVRNNYRFAEKRIFLPKASRPSARLCLHIVYYPDGANRTCIPPSALTRRARLSDLFAIYRAISRKLQISFAFFTKIVLLYE